MKTIFGECTATHNKTLEQPVHEPAMKASLSPQPRAHAAQLPVIHKKMNIPNKIYKYQTFNKLSLSNLRECKIYFNTPSKFNDPFDCTMATSHIPTPEEFERAYYQTVSDNKNAKVDNGLNLKCSDVFKEDLIDIIEKENYHDFFQIGVACFSEKNDDILMWAHYSDGHKGFCLEFDTSHTPFNRIKPVDYNDNLPDIDFYKLLFSNDKEGKLEENKKIGLTKYTCWEYEKEWRIFSRKPKIHASYPPNALTGIYFGSNMDFSYMEIVALIAQKSNKTINLYKAKKDPLKYAVNHNKMELK